MHASAADTAKILIAAANGDRLLALPEDLIPQTRAEALAVQQEMIGQLGPVGGWKVGPKTDENAPAPAPIPASWISQAPGKFSLGRYSKLEVELEIGIQIATDLKPKDGAFAWEDVKTAIGSARVALELLGSRFVDRHSVSPLTAMADLGNNAGIIVGQQIPESDWLAQDFVNLPFSLSINGNVVTQQSSTATSPQVFAALTWLAGYAGQEAGGLKAGDFVITGARIGPLEVKVGDVITGRVGNSSVDLTIVA